MLPTLRPYQLTIGQAVRDSIRNRRGLTFTVEIARQGGKNELSAQLQLWLLTANAAGGGAAVKCAPTFVPQCLISIERLRARLDGAGYRGRWHAEHGHTIRLGRRRRRLPPPPAAPPRPHRSNHRPPCLRRPGRPASTLVLA